MKLCFYSPYLPKHFGGGEKHLFDVAIAAAQSHEVSIAISGNQITEQNLQEYKNTYTRFSGGDFNKIKFIETPLGTDVNPIAKVWWTKQFDGLYYVTDGSLFFSAAKNNFLHLQIPFTSRKNSFIEKVKLSNWNHRNANSFFTKNIVEKSWGMRVDTVLYPMVSIDELATTQKKEKIILSVGRFFRKLHSKRQDILINIFKKLRTTSPKLLEDWKLYLVGSGEDKEYYDFVKSIAEGLPIVFKPDCSRDELVALYKKASIYWHAAGYEIDEKEHPEMVEHFGITTIEAMAAGAVPVVVEKGGQREILEKFPELGWYTEEDCVNKTLSLIKKPTLQTELRERVLQRAKDFDQKKFTERVLHLFSI